MKIVPIHAANPGHMTGDGNWTYLLPGSVPVLVDAGVGHPRHLDTLFGLAPDGPGLVMVTHAHPDHASGAPALAARAPAARFVKFSWPERDAAVGVAWEPLEDGQRLSTDQGAIDVIHTPGHSPDHAVFWHEDSGTVFAGDLLVPGGTVVIPASDGGSLSEYLRSLRRVAALGPRRALPAHGDPIDDPLALIDHYLSHRLRREQQVLQALADGDSLVGDIVSRIYLGLEPALVPQARESVLAHLQKLEDDGAVVLEDGHWRRRT